MPFMRKLNAQSTWEKTCYYSLEKIMSPVALYASETQSLTLREKQRLRVYENKVFEAKRDEITGEWTKLHMLYMIIPRLT